MGIFVEEADVKKAAVKKGAAKVFQIGLPRLSTSFRMGTLTERRMLMGIGMVGGTTNDLILRGCMRKRHMSERGGTDDCACCGGVGHHIIRRRGMYEL